MSAAGGNSSTKETRIISQEFRYLKVKMHGDMDIGKLAANKSRNRNRNILPFDGYRVVLSGNNSGSDYINATYYNGTLPRNRYIAAMGPMKATAADFWQMIWQENVAVIVMITRLKEGSKMKCFQYWPDPSEDIGRMYNGLTVRCISDEMFTHFRMRKISLSKNERAQQITQLHFQEWDELKTPKSEHDFLTFYDKVESVHAQHSAAPLLVQSSCGAGRAGTFIAVHDLLTYGRTSNGVNVYECVRRLRDRRPEMVQTEAQYTFIYKILKLRNIQPIHNDI